jgi:hypothetical protein
MVRKRERYPGLMRAIYELAAREPALAELRHARRAAFFAHWRSYLTMLAERGFTERRDPESSAVVLATMLEGYLRAVTLDALDPATIAAATDLIDAAIFGRLEPEASGD